FMCYIRALPSKLRRLAAIRRPTGIPMLQPFPAHLPILPPQSLRLAIAQLEHDRCIASLQRSTAHSPHNFHPFQLTTAHGRPLQQDLLWLEALVYGDTSNESVRGHYQRVSTRFWEHHLPVSHWLRRGANMTIARCYCQLQVASSPLLPLLQFLGLVRYGMGGGVGSPGCGIGAGGWIYAEIPHVKIHSIFPQQLDERVLPGIEIARWRYLHPAAG